MAETVSCPSSWLSTPQQHLSLHQVLCEGRNMPLAAATTHPSPCSDTKGWGLFPLTEKCQTTRNGSERLSLAQVSSLIWEHVFRRKRGSTSQKSLFCVYMLYLQTQRNTNDTGNEIPLEWNEMKIPCVVFHCCNNKSPQIYGLKQPKCILLQLCSQKSDTVSLD